MRIITIVLTILFSMKGMRAFSYDVEIDGICYNLTGTEATVVKNSSKPYSGIISIPPAFIYNGITFNVSSIGACAFYGCTGLTSITIPNSVKSIGEKSFCECSALTSITIPKSVISIEIQAFMGCVGLASMDVEEGNTVFDSRNNCNAIIETVKNKLVAGCKSTVIPEDVICIGWSAFENCTSLKAVTIPNNVTRIDGRAFWGCSNLTSITIPTSVTSIYTNPFAYCDSLKEINVQSGNPVFDSRGNCNAIIRTKSNSMIVGCTQTIIPEGIISLGSAFTGCRNLTSINIPSSVTSLGAAFYDCINLKSVTIPKGVTEIGYGVFYRCKSLKTVTIPEGVVKIQPEAFCYCSSLISINIPDSVVSIGTHAFNRCVSLSSVVIGKKLSLFENEVFAACDSLASVQVKQSRPFNIPQNTFSETAYKNATLFVPKGSRTYFREASVWNNFLNIEEMDMPDVDVSKSPFDNVESNQMILGYYRSKDYSGYSIGGIEKGLYKHCIGFDRAGSKPFVGNKITHIRFALENINISSTKVWIGSSRYQEPLYEQGVSSLNTGWNEIKLETPFEIHDDSLFVGIEYYQDECNFPILTTKSSNSYEEEGCSYAFGPYGEDKEYRWIRTNKGLSSECKLSLQCLIEGEHIPLFDIHPVHISLDKHYYKSGDQCLIWLYLRNWGKKDIESYDISCLVDGVEVERIPNHSLTKLDVSDIKAISFWSKIPELSVGIHTISLCVKSINGEVPLYVDDDTLSIDMKYYKEKLERQKIYIECITSASLCPSGISFLYEWKDWQLRYNDVAFVLLHDSSDGLFCDAVNNYAVFYPFIGSKSFNRYTAPGGYDLQIAARSTILLNDFRAMPSFANVNILADYHQASRSLRIKVYGECIDDFFLLEEYTNLTVLLTEDDVVYPQYDGENNKFIYDFKHQAVLRTNVSDVWGDPITWNGNRYEKEYTVILDEEWEKDNMKIVAFLSKPFTGDNYDEIYVINCNDFAVKDATSVGIEGISESEVNTSDVYSVSGVKVKSHGTSLAGLPKGIYIVNGKKINVK